MAILDEGHYWRVARLCLEGYVIPFLGAGASLADRSGDAAAKPGVYPPSGIELAEILAKNSRYPEKAEDLLRVSQYVDAMLGERTLYRDLRKVFTADYTPNSLHRLLAGMPAILRRRRTRHQLVITTNYDDALERAFVREGEDFDLVWYEAKRGRSRGKFIHRPPNGEPSTIDVPNEYDALSLETRPVILKVHGAVHREDANLDSFVITENNYIDYLAHGDISAQIPMVLYAAMKESNFLFLGYSMRDWNLRVILNRLWGESGLTVKSWAVQLPDPNPGHNEIEDKLWKDRGEVELLQLPLEEYVENLSAQLYELSESEMAPQ